MQQHKSNKITDNSKVFLFCDKMMQVLNIQSIFQQEFLFFYSCGFQ